MQLFFLAIGEFFPKMSTWLQNQDKAVFKHGGMIEKETQLFFSFKDLYLFELIILFMY